jgi:hypothetical protein
MRRHKTSPRRYDARTLKILWGRAAGRCAIPECRIDLFAEATKHDPIVPIGDIAHIEAASNKGPRANRMACAKDRDQYKNLILLCKNCHARLDGQKNTNTVDVIRKLKADHEAWVRASLPERGKSTTGWKVVLLQGAHPIDADQVEAALSPDFQKGKPLLITANPSDGDWNTLLRQMTQKVQALLRDGDSFDRRFAVFPLAPVSACLALGYLLTNRPRVRLFQFHRHVPSWQWPAIRTVARDLKVRGLPARPKKGRGHVVVCFNLSASIQSNHIAPVRRGAIGVVHVLARDPSTAWLCASAQLDELGSLSSGLFESLMRKFPNASGWHILYAGPAPGAVKIGQQLNPTMTPLVHLYEFCASDDPKYQASTILRGDRHG